MLQVYLQIVYYYDASICNSVDNWSNIHLKVGDRLANDTYNYHLSSSMI